MIKNTLAYESKIYEKSSSSSEQQKTLRAKKRDTGITKSNGAKRKEEDSSEF
jgi:hypothetical protein